MSDQICRLCGATFPFFQDFITPRLLQKKKIITAIQGDEAGNFYMSTMNFFDKNNNKQL